MTPSDLAAWIAGSHWLMEPRAFRAMVGRLSGLVHDVNASEVEAALRDREPPTARMVEDIAVIEAVGPITYRPSLFSFLLGSSTIEGLQGQFRQALADPSVRAVAFRWDSPGGVVDMVPEFADEVFAARGIKPIISIADTTIASAAYWIASQSDRIYVSASSQLGAIGVFTAHEDISGMLAQEGIKITLISHGEHKVEENPYEPLTEEARAEMQRRVDQVGGEFEAAVARGRGVTTREVLDRFGQGRVFRGRRAISLGLADKLGTIGQAMARMRKGSRLAAESETGSLWASLETEPLVQAQPEPQTESTASPSPAANVMDWSSTSSASFEASVDDVDEAALLSALLDR